MRRRRRSALAFGALAAAAVVLAACGDDGGAAGGGIAFDTTPATAPFPGLTETRLAVGDDCLRLVVADDTDERTVGLTGRSDLGDYDGMLFVFATDSASTFTMSGVPVPLSIGWYDASGEPVGRTEMEPCADSRDECPSYAADDRYRYAVETPGGGLSSGGLGGCP